MPQQNTEVLEILLRQIADDREVNGVVREALGVLGQAELFEPVRDLLHRDSASFRVGLSTFSLPESGTTSTPQLGIARRACPLGPMSVSVIWRCRFNFGLPKSGRGRAD